MAQSKIEWTEMSWNPTTGCTKVSAGCTHCYAETMTKRLTAMGHEKYQNGFKLTLHEEELSTPYTWKSPKIVFVNSMSDLFHEEVPFSFVDKVFKVMNDNPQHVFQILTKRSKRLEKLSPYLKWTHNVWLGVSIENEFVLDRVDDLKNTEAKVKFLSCEPLIGPLKSLNLTGIDWVIVGGESGRNPRPMKREWVREIKDQCKKYDVRFFFKQWGGTNRKKTGRILDGEVFNEMPEIEFEKNNKLSR